MDGVGLDEGITELHRLRAHLQRGRRRRREPAPVTRTGLSAEEPSSFATSNVGTGTAWFVSIAEGLAIPIDEQELFLLQ